MVGLIILARKSSPGVLPGKLVLPVSFLVSFVGGGPNDGRLLVVLLITEGFRWRVLVVEDTALARELDRTG